MARRRHGGLFWLAAALLIVLLAPPGGQVAPPLAAQATAAGGRGHSPVRASPAGGALVCAPRDQVNGEVLRFYFRPDYRKEVYLAAGDPYLEYGLRQLDRYWSNFDLSLLRGYVDGLLPLELRRLDHRGAGAMMTRFRLYLERQRDPQTGLIPYTNGGLDDKLGIDLAGRQTLRMLPLMAELLGWFPNDPATLQTVREMADATMRHFDAPPVAGRPAGLVDWVRVDQPDDFSGRYLAQDLAGAARGAAAVGVASGEPRYINWANQKLAYLWAQRTNPPLPLLPEALGPAGWDSSGDDAVTSDTDTLYTAQQLFEIYFLTDDPLTRYRAMSVSKWWYEHAWLPEYGQFVRKLRRADGTPHEPRIYSDGKYNILFTLVYAYRVSGDPRYLDRFKEAWAGMLRSGQGGFVADSIEEGQFDREHGLDPAQSFFVEALVAAHRASGDPELLDLADDFAGRLLRQRRDLIRENSGQGATAYLRLALARGPIGRLTVDLNSCGAPRSRITIRQEGRTLLDTIIYADIAVVYLPAGTYTLTTAGPAGQRSETVTVAEYRP